MSAMAEGRCLGPTQSRGPKLQPRAAANVKNRKAVVEYYSYTLFIDDQ